MLNDSEFLSGYKADVTRLTTEQRETIDAIVRGLKDCPPYLLSEMVHREKPWRDARGDLSAGARCENVIPKEAMLEYYQENL